MQNICQVCKSASICDDGDMRWNIGGVSYALQKCSACECVFTSPQPADATLAQFYRSGFNYHWYLDYFGAKLLDCQMRMDEYRLVLGRKVLDFGGGLGYFSLVARLQGFDAVTYDPYTTGNEPEKHAWDTVVALHVLEHSNNLDRTVCHIKEFMRPGGRLIVAVPNYRCRGYRQLGMRWVWAQPPMLHIFHFTSGGLRILLERHGLETESVSFHERWDANLLMDLEQVDRTQGLEAEWFSDGVNQYPEKRAKVAWRNSLARFEGFEQARMSQKPGSDEYAELQIIAR